MANDVEQVVKLNKPTVCIYRTIYRLPSEAFLKEQVSAIVHHNVHVLAREFTATAYQESSSLSLLPLTNGGRYKKFQFTFFSQLKVTIPETRLIHAHFAPDAAVIMPLAQRLNCPLVMTCHGFDVLRSRWELFKTFRPTNWIFLWREKALYRRVKRVIAVSEFLKEKLIKRGCPAEKIVVGYIGIDTEKFNCETTKSRRTKTIIHVGRHVEWKGIDVLLRALAILKIKDPDIQLRQIGSGKDTDSLLALSRELGLENNVVWLGALPHKEVKEELCRASLYAHPSRTDSAGQTEAFGIALLEAQACGLPVVASNSGGIPEAMRNGVTGFLVPENDHLALAEKLQLLLTSPDIMADMGLQARKFVLTEFDIHVKTNWLEQIYHEVINYG